MPDQPDLEQRIADILETHMIRTDPNHPAYRSCRCGNQARDDELGDYELEDWRHHVAEVLVTELGLTPEYGVVYECDLPELPEEITESREQAYVLAAEKCQSCDHCRNALPKRVEVRYVSKWVPDA